jgi:hypothetical protein
VGTTGFGGGCNNFSRKLGGILFLWNPNGRLGSDGGWQVSFYPPLRMADLVLGQKFSVAKTKYRFYPRKSVSICG